ncbi:hypothetical protein ACQ4M3_05600 [Leptolyngbya sp. AN03gr2]|uniref:hypothetical protein n=1 Tax=unclassified Leptolyngbya TaxID=2650499 RepID=UPI003D320995
MSRSFRMLKRDCPVCQGARRDCREHISTGRIHCRDLDANPPGFRYVGEDSLGFLMWIDADSNQNSATSQRDRSEIRKALTVPLRPVLSVEERDRQFRRICFQSGYPASRHRQDLIRRGLSEEQIERAHREGLLWTWVSGADVPGVTIDLPGVDSRRRLRQYQGFAIVVPDPDGKVLGAQIKPNFGKYFWVSSETIDGAGIYLPNGEVPIGFYRPPEAPKRAEINLAEGFLKPLITAQRFGLIVIGAAGGHWIRSPKLLSAYLEQAARELGTNIVVLNADGGAVQNRDVLTQYRATWNQLQSWGYHVKIRWWGQTVKANGDIDEIDQTTFDQAALISVDQFEAIAAQQENLLVQELKHVLRKLTPRMPPKRGFAPPAAPSASDRILEYQASDRLSVWQSASQRGYRYILDLSTTGGGKSYTTGQITPGDFGAKQIFYVSNEHRNPTTQTLVQGWTDLEARHAGLVNVVQPDGSSRLQRVSPNEPYSVPPNCNRTQLIGVLRSKNVQGADTASLICGTCPLKECCTHNQGNGYGFLYQRREALLATKVRSHPDSLAAPSDYNYGEVLLAWDEAGQSFKVSRKIQVTLSDVDALIRLLLSENTALLETLKPLINALIQLFTAKSGRFGLSHSEVLARLPELSSINLDHIAQLIEPNLGFLNTTAEYGVDLQELPRNLRKQFLESDRVKAEQANQLVLKQWFIEFLMVVEQRIPGAYLSFHRQTLTLTMPDSRHRAIANSAKATIFLDATLTPEELARKLQCPLHEIFVCRQTAPALENLAIRQITDLGRMGMQRGKQQERRLAALIEHYRSIDPTTKVIDFKKFGADGAHWRDGRGVNTFLDTKTLLIVGAPCPNLLEMLSEFTALTGTVAIETMPEFQAWLHQTIQAELIQEIGRLRSHRRSSESLQVVLITDFPVSFEVELLKASEVTVEAATQTEQLTIAIQQAVDYLQAIRQKPTQAAIAEQVGVSQGYISRKFRKLLQLLLDPDRNTSHTHSTSSSVDLTSVAEEALSACQTPIQVLETIYEVFLSWIPPSDRQSTWRLLTAQAHIKAISALLLTLMPQDVAKLSINFRSSG